MKIEKTTDIDPLWDLLLLADPSREIVQGYLADSEVYVAKSAGRSVGLYVLVPLGDSGYEIKNIAVDPGFQKQGIGAALLEHARTNMSERPGSRLRICTGNTSTHQVALYQKAGFDIVGVDKGFFVRNYPEPIYENGARCEDLIILEQDF